MGIAPSAWVLPFSPPRVIPLVHLGLGVVGDLQRFRVLLVLPLDRGAIVEDGVGLREFLEGLGLLDSFEPVAQAVEDVLHAAYAGERVAAVALLVLERLEHLAGRQVGVAPCGLQFGVGQRVRLDEGTDVSGKLGILDLRRALTAGAEVLEAADAGAGLVLPGGDGGAAEAEPPFGSARAAVAEGVGDLGLEESTLLPGEPARRRTD